jgi:hypothetical protein
MSKETAELLEAFEALPTADKQASAVKVLRRTDDEIGEAGRSYSHSWTGKRMPP